MAGFYPKAALEQLQNVDGDSDPDELTDDITDDSNYEPDPQTSSGSTQKRTELTQVASPWPLPLYAKTPVSYSASVTTRHGEAGDWMGQFGKNSQQATTQQVKWYHTMSLRRGRGLQITQEEKSAAHSTVSIVYLTW